MTHSSETSQQESFTTGESSRRLFATGSPERVCSTLGRTLRRLQSAAPSHQHICRGGGAGAEIIGLEARASFAEYAQENLDANRIAGTVHLAAAWDVSGTPLGMPRVDLSKFASGGSFGIVMGDEAPEEYVTSVALDDLDMKSRVSIIKLDVQGAELRALQGATRILREHAPTVIFEFEEMFAPDFGTTFGDYVDFLLEMDYGIREVVGSNNFLALPDRYYRDLAVSDFNVKRKRLPESVFRAGIESEVSRRRSLVV